MKLHRIQRNLTFRFLRFFGGPGFANPAFPPSLLLKHLFIQKVLRINRGVPWPVHPSSKVSGVNKIDSGTRCPGLSPGCYIQGKNGIVLGKNVWIGPGVGIISADHNLVDYFQHNPSKPIRIGDNCWIGMNAVILAGVELGDHIVVGAGAVVTCSFASNCVIAGNPARVIKQLGVYGEAE